MPNPPEIAVLTVAAIRTPKEDGPTEYLFNERQRTFTLRRAAKSAEDYAERLTEALRRKTPVLARLDLRRGLIQRIDAASPKDLAEFERRPLLDEPNRGQRIDLDEIDPTTFNLVDFHLKVPSYRHCQRIIPNYKTANKIFKFCAKQSCNLPGPYDISPCIPFQYVRDGCYARAHKMRWIITTRYRYCCEKVFSFANQDLDRLAVQANKWGGCCVTWWYHVAPLVRVRVRAGRLSVVLALVIDPGMFDKPVLLSTWLSAQGNAACDPHADVSMYSIQPGSAYSPANYAGTMFTTDPAYTATDATLTAYSSLTTCP